MQKSRCALTTRTAVLINFVVRAICAKLELQVLKVGRFSNGWMALYMDHSALTKSSTWEHMWEVEGELLFSVCYSFSLLLEGYLNVILTRFKTPVLSQMYWTFSFLDHHIQSYVLLKMVHFLHHPVYREFFCRRSVSASKCRTVA